MMALSKRARFKGLVHHAAWFAIFATAFSYQPAAADAPRPKETLDVTIDQARIVKLPDRVSTIVIGNPLIADASIQAGGLMVLTGKGYGSTNLIALDRSGNSLLEKTVIVQGPGRDIVVVYKGVNRETYSCAPVCQPRITLGDAQPFFAQSITQTTTRNTQAAATAAK